MQVLITGANGFIGQRLMKFLERTDYSVIGIDKEIGDSNKLIQCDLTKINSVKNIFQKYSPESIIHLAAISSTRISYKNMILTQKINYMGTVNLFEISKKYNPNLKYFCFASSAEVYGGSSSNSREFLETDPLNPVTPYAFSKFISEKFLQLKQYETDIKICIFRFCNTFGRLNSNSFLVEYLFDRFMKNKSPLLNNPFSVREFMYLPDHLEAYGIFLKEKAKGILNVSSGDSLSVLEIARKIKNLTQSNMEIKIKETVSPTKIIMNSEKMQNLGFMKKFKLDDALCDYYNEIRKR